MNRTIKLFIAFLILAVPAGLLFTRPEYTLTTGNRCMNCHISPQGGAQRNILGAYARNESSLIQDEKILKFFSDFNSMNNFANEKVVWGFDLRWQTARLGDPSNSQRKYFGMQAIPYLTYQPINWMKLSGHYNLPYALDFLSDDNKTIRYPGQATWSASIYIQPTYDYPTLRMGYFSPSIGTKYDDHTMFNRAVWTTYPQTILPPDNNEIGIELNYDRPYWIQLTAGIYGTETMSNIKLANLNGERVSLADGKTPAYLFKTVFTPRFNRNFINTYIGGSYFISNDYNITNLFAGIGLTDKAALMGEYTITEKKDIRNSDNLMLVLYYPLHQGFAFTLRYEKAYTKDYTKPNAQEQLSFSNFTTDAYVLGANVYPLPNIEIRPEFRILDRKDFESFASQWTLQLHFYY